MKRTLAFTGLTLVLAVTARADFSTIPLAPASFNHDVVVESAAPASLSVAVNATQDAGTNKTGNTWYSIGYNAAAPTTGLPAAGSVVAATNVASHSYLMPPDYHTNNVVLVGHNGGGDTPLIPFGRLTLTTPAPFASLSFLTSAGNGPVLVGYVVNYADASSESNTRRSWKNTSCKPITPRPILRQRLFESAVLGIA